MFIDDLPALRRVVTVQRIVSTLRGRTAPTVSDVQSRYVTTNGIRLFCLEAGPPDGPCVLLLHGFPELAYAWRQQVAALGAAGYHVIAPDLPGYGRSDKPDVTYDCDWIDVCLMGVVDAMGAQQVVIAGHDWGGLLVWIMARQYPAELRA